MSSAGAGSAWTWRGLRPRQQFQIVSAIEKDEKAFFELVRAHTMQGYYGTPRHGGNRDAVSWRMLGLDEPPLAGARAIRPDRRGEAMKRVNAVVVGAGAAGGIVAKELATAGLSVVLLERGKWYTAARLPQGRSAQSTDHGAGERVRAGR